MASQHHVGWLLAQMAAKLLPGLKARAILLDALLNALGGAPRWPRGCLRAYCASSVAKLPWEVTEIRGGELSMELQTQR